MRVVLAVLAVLVVFGGGSILSQAQSAIHEIEAFMLFLIGAVLFTGAAVVDAVVNLRNELAKQRS